MMRGSGISRQSSVDSRRSRVVSRESSVMSQIQRLELFEHVGDARANEIALVAERRQLAGERFVGGDPAACGLELARQTLIFFKRSRLLRLHAIDKTDEPLQL